MGKPVAVVLWICGAVHVLWALQSNIVFWRDLATTMYLAAGLCCLVAGLLFFILGDIEHTLRLFDRRFHAHRKRPEDVVLDVTEAKSTGGKKNG